MARVQPQAHLRSGQGRFPEGGNRGFRVPAIVMGILFGVQFHPVRTRIAGSPDHFGIRVHKNGRPDTGTAEGFDHPLKEIPVGDGVPAGIGGNGVRGVRHQGHLVGPNFQYQIDKRRDGIALHVQFRGDHRLQVAGILITDMALVRARVDGDSLSPEDLDVPYGLHQVRQFSAAGIPQGGNFIHIYA